MATEATKYTCVVCLDDFEATQPARTCSPRCRKRYQRYRQNGGEELPYRVVAVTPRHTDVTPTPPSHEQAALSNEQMELLRQLVTDMATLKTFMLAILGGDGLADQKKSEVLASIVVNHVQNIDPPKAKLLEETPEQVAKRERETVKNTVAALEDF